MKITKAKIKSLSHIGSCGAYGTVMVEMPKLDDLTVVCTADLKFFSGLERFHDRYPDRLYNVGIAEQNLLGVAGGLAGEGFHPYASTYAAFACTRALDQVKVNMGYMKLPIRLIGLTSGFSVGILGPTHICTEDISIMRSIPNITILQPADATEIVKSIQALAGYDSPVYVRLTGSQEMPIVYQEDYEYEIGKAVKLREGCDVGIIATGSMVSVALAASEILIQYGIYCSVLNMHTIRPMDTVALDGLRKTKLLVTIEEHSILGGLGGSVAEYISRIGSFPILEMIGVSGAYPHAADYQFLLEKFQLTPDGVASRILWRLGKVEKNNMGLGSIF